MVDLARYPLDALATEQGRAFVADCRRRYVRDGACLLPSFVRPAALGLMAAEANGIAGQAFFCEDSHTPYLAAADQDLDASHPRNRRQATRVGSVAYDRLPADGLIRRLYRWPPLKDFIAGVLAKERLFHFADQLGACSVNVFKDGSQHGWHFDESEFTITLMLQEPERGGDFEYVAKIRGARDEYEQVARALDGSNENIRRLPFSPGALLVFAGRDTLHRVTPVSGARLRLVPVLCYSDRPDQVNSDQVRRLFWGRTGLEVAT